jgi:c-di-GMP-binding flagellar brake protein YcgR
MNPRHQGPERRAGVRVDITESLQAVCDATLRSEVIQISTGGMLIEMTSPLSEGSRHQFRLLLNGEKLEVAGVVRYCQALEGGEEVARNRLGIEFQALDPRGRSTLERFIAGRLDG